MHLREPLLRLCPDFEKCSIPTNFGTSNTLHARHFLKADPYNIKNSRYIKVFNIGKTPHVKALIFQSLQCCIPPSLPSSPSARLPPPQP